MIDTSGNMKLLCDKNYIQIAELDLEYTEETLNTNIYVYTPTGCNFSTEDMIFIRKQKKYTSDTLYTVKTELYINVDNLPLFNNPEHDDTDDKYVCIVIDYANIEIDPSVLVVYRYQNEVEQSIAATYHLTDQNVKTFLYLKSNTVLTDWSTTVINSHMTTAQARVIYQILFPDQSYKTNNV
jgi:hypothetical protein